VEPLEQPVAARPEDDRDERDDAQRERIRQLVIARTGQPPRELRLLHADAGLVVFVSVVVAAQVCALAAASASSGFG
jgi:hypothetical protein